LLHLHANTEHFYIVGSYIYANNNKKGTCFSVMATINTTTHRNVTLSYIVCLVVTAKISLFLIGLPWLSYAVAQLVEALRYKPESYSDFSLFNPSGRTVAPGSTQPLTKMSTADISWGVKAAGA
jgi:hypothetical protein